MGRADEVSTLLRWLDPGGTQEGVVSGVAGLPGVGKTALARHAASQAVDRGWFPGGAVMADLHGYDSAGRVEAAGVFGPLLRALGLSGAQVPATEAEQAAAYHHLLATTAEPVLLLLDNVSSQRQIAGLLPVHRLHRVLVTSRHSLGDPVTALLELGTLPPEKSVELVGLMVRARRRGDQRVARRPEQAAALAELCGRLPLALRIAGALLADDPDLSVADLVADLEDPPTRLEGLAHGDDAVAAAFDLSWRHLCARDEHAARLFRLLTVSPGPDISQEAAAIVAGQPERDARRQLRVLRHAHLIEPGGAPGRWSMHDLIRLYATELSCAHAAEDDRDAALDRLLDFYREMAAAAGAWVSSPAGKQPPGDRFETRGQALAWLDSERANLIPAARTAFEAGKWRHVTTAAESLNHYLEQRYFIEEWIALARLAVSAAPRVGRGHEWAAASNLGSALRNARLFDEAVTHLTRARDLAVADGYPHDEGKALHNLGLAYFRMGRFADAERCHRRDLAICVAVGDRLGAAQTMVALGDALRMLGEFTEARQMFGRAIADLEDLGDTANLAGARLNLALTWLRWRPEGKERAGYVIWLLCKALQAARDLDDQRTQAMIFHNLGEAYLSRCQACHPLDGRDWYRATADFSRSLGDRFLEATALLGLGEVEARLKETSAARQHLRQGIGILRDLGESGEEERGRELLRHISEITLNAVCQHQSAFAIGYRDWLIDLPHAVLRGDDARLEEYLFLGNTVIQAESAATLTREMLRHREDATTRASATASADSAAAAKALRAQFPERISPTADMDDALRFSSQVDAIWAAMKPTLRPGEQQDGLIEILQLRGWQVVQATSLYGHAQPSAEAVAAAAVNLNVARAVLDDCERFLGPRHPETSRAVNNLAGLVGQVGDYDQACALLTRVVRHAAPATRRDPEMLRYRHNLGFMHLNAGRPRRALRILSDVLADSERTLGSDHADIRETRHWLEVARISCAR